MQVSVTYETQDIPGVTCVVVRHTGIVDGRVVTADPFDDYAQNKAGRFDTVTWRKEVPL